MCVCVCLYISAQYFLRIVYEMDKLSLVIKWRAIKRLLFVTTKKYRVFIMETDITAYIY